MIAGIAESAKDGKLLEQKSVSSPLTDEALMLQVRDGRVSKLALLFERHHRSLFNFFYRLTGRRDQSEDLVQDVFFRILKYRETYEPRTSFASWMYQVARNTHADGYRKTRGESPWSNEVNEPVSREMTIEERLGKRQEVAILRRALAALPVNKREVLILSRYHNLKYEEIGQILGCEAGAVKLRVYRAVRALGRIFSEMAGETQGGQQA
ncbi:MAG: RNA polymerase sigma factor [Bryobacteraceae bacterium]